MKNLKTKDISVVQNKLLQYDKKGIISNMIFCERSDYKRFLSRQKESGSKWQNYKSRHYERTDLPVGGMSAWSNRRDCFIPGKLDLQWNTDNYFAITVFLIIETNTTTIAKAITTNHCPPFHKGEEFMFIWILSVQK